MHNNLSEALDHGAFSQGFAVSPSMLCESLDHGAFSQGFAVSPSLLCEALDHGAFSQGFALYQVCYVSHWTMEH